MFVGNNWDGTADMIDPRTFEHLGRINTIPDREERMAEILTSPDKLAFFLAIRNFVGEGNDQFTDDMFTTHDGRLVAVSRPSFADVVGISLRTEKIVWRFPMDGYRSDHMAVSPDGRRLLVSDSTENVVHELNIRTGEKTGEFPSGDSPHENNYSEDGSLIYHASIGRVYTPTDRCAPALPPSTGCLPRDTSKGDRRFQIVDADSLKILKRWDMGEELDEFAERTGRQRYARMSSAVRPMALSPNERYAYLQVSFHHGLVKFDLRRGRVRRVVDLPISKEARNTPREQYLLDSAHHGIAMNSAGNRLCAAGTMSDYAAIVSRRGFRTKIASRGTKPYWSTNGPNGRRCWVSYSGDDEVAVLNYRTRREITRIPVGDHPQRIRVGVIRKGLASGGPAGSLCRGREVTHSGTGGDDTIRGTAGVDVIRARPGDDVIRARGGDDVICANEDEDTVRAGGGDDYVSGGRGDDDDRLRGGAGDDEIRAQRGKDVLGGGGGSDFLLGNRQDDLLRGGKGPDRLLGNKGNDSLRGGSGNDACRGGAGSDRVRAC
jgi:YVTN family beta-propeller protein